MEENGHHPPPHESADDQSQLVVELKGVTKNYGDVKAVDNVSLGINKGEFFSLLGSSGCGKTTTLRLIGGFEHPDIGDVYIDGKRANNVAPHKRDTNLVFQHLALFPHLDVYDNIAFGLARKRVDKQEIKKRVYEMLSMVELGGLENRRVNQISGGQKQRVAIARALINHPAVLLLDEPLGALDLKLRMQMQLELKAIQKRVGTTFIYVTHDQSEALTMSDRIAVMRGGRIEQIGPSQEIYQRPATKFVATFIGDANLMDGRKIAKKGDDAIIDVGGTWMVVPDVGDNISDEVTVFLRPERVKLCQDLPSDTSENTFQGQIANMIFLGSKLYYEVALAGGGPIVKVETLYDVGEPYHEGDKVTISWPKEAAVLLQ